VSKKKVPLHVQAKGLRQKHSGSRKPDLHSDRGKKGYGGGDQRAGCENLFQSGEESDGEL